MVTSIHANYKITVNDEDVTEKVRKYFIDLQLTDNDKDQADELVLTLSKKFKRPAYQDTIKVFLGWGSELKFAGLFFVQTNTIKDNKQLTIKATSVNFNGDLKQRRHLSYVGKSLDKVVAEIANRHGLQTKTNVIVGNRFEQIDESDLHFLNRLAKEHDAIFNIKNNTLYFIKKGSEVPTISIDINQCENSDITYSNKTIYKSCKAIYQDTKTNQQASATAGSGTPQLVKQGQWQNNQDALTAAKNALIRADKAKAEGSLTTRGRVIFAGSKLELNNEIFEVKKVTHNIKNGWKITVDFKDFSA